MLDSTVTYCGTVSSPRFLVHQKDMAKLSCVRPFCGYMSNGKWLLRHSI